MNIVLLPFIAITASQPQFDDLVNALPEFVLFNFVVLVIVDRLLNQLVHFFELLIDSDACLLEVDRFRLGKRLARQECCCHKD